MHAGSKIAHLNIQLDGGPEVDADELDRTARQLLDQVRELEVESAELTVETAPEGSKAAPAVTIGSLTIGLLPVVLPKLLDLFNNWANRRPDRTMKIKATVGNRAMELEFSPTATTPDQLKAYVERIAGAISSEG